MRFVLLMLSPLEFVSDFGLLISDLPPHPGLELPAPGL
jgi:hypothetical protein